MPDPNTPLLSEEQRQEAVRLIDNMTFSPATRREAVRAALKELARLRALVDALALELACVSHDRMEEGAAALVERAVGEERLACAKLRCPMCRDGEPARQDSMGFWFHDKPGMASCVANDILNRGPLKPPLPPTEVVRENEALRGVLARIVEAVDGERGGIIPMPAEAIEAARGLLGRGK